MPLWIGVRKIDGVYTFSTGEPVGSYHPWTDESQSSPCVLSIEGETWTKGIQCENNYTTEYACQGPECKL